MTMESVAPEQVLKQGQPISITARSGCCTLKLCGTIRGLSHQALTVSLAVSDREFLLVPSAGTDADCAIIGNGCVYHFASTARSASALPLKIWYLELPPVVYRVQQRRFVRVPLALPMQVRLPGAHGSLHNPADTMLVDISGGGLCFASASEVPPARASPWISRICRSTGLCRPPRWSGAAPLSPFSPAPYSMSAHRWKIA